MLMQIFHQTISFLAQDSAFWACALVGTFCFLIGLISTFFGLSPESLDGVAFFGDLFAFKWLSLQGLFGFWMLFGWTGLTCKKEFFLSDGASLGWGFAAGCIAFISSTVIFNLMRKLHSSGNEFTFSRCVGKKGIVLQEISPPDFGKISLSFEGITYEVSASAEEKISSFTSVIVTGHVEEVYLVVTPHIQDGSYGS